MNIKRYTNVSNVNNSITITHQEKKPCKTGCALEMLKRINTAVNTQAESTRNIQEPDFNKKLKEEATAIKDAYLTKTQAKNRLVRWLWNIGEKEKEVERIYQEIITPKEQRVQHNEEIEGTRSLVETFGKHQEIKDCITYTNRWRRTIDIEATLQNLKKKGLSANLLNTMLESAIFNNNVAMAKLVLELGADPNAKISNEPGSQKKYTPLAMAARQGNMSLISLLLDKGANPNQRSNHELTPLSEAIMKISQPEQRLSIVRLLLDRGAQTNPQPPPARPNMRMTYSQPLHSAIRIGDPAIVQLLLERNANANATNGDDETTPLALLLHPRRPPLSPEIQQQLFQLLIEKGADVNKYSTDWNNQGSPFHLIVRYGTLEMLRAVIDQVDDIDALYSLKQGSKPVTAEQRAEEQELTRNMADLMKKGSIKGYSGEPLGQSITSLGLAAQRGDIEIVKFLLDKGANPTVANPASYAQDGQVRELLQRYENAWPHKPSA